MDNNLVMNFTETNFSHFKDFTAQMDANEHTLPFPDGQERMVMRTPANDINFTFTPDEWDDFCDAMEEATHMLAVYSLME
ncbi:hypothetical protein KXQ82_13210 [Mucilaginibacter sp. HMF5004]|uniref:hypothetical protein n=1 Tax=Mucilaginibacter rivuli TaxID=2857527 RepID=UPI001C5D9315|nr:hypothetical protein [Mucilaginibacter rivuli]MBW4890688.1 hypothetical protein [Mucilaginibacter rivuli]